MASHGILCACRDGEEGIESMALSLKKGQGACEYSWLEALSAISASGLKKMVINSIAITGRRRCCGLIANLLMKLTGLAEMVINQ